MAVDADKLKIVFYPDPVLRTKADPIEAVDAEIRAVAAKMLQLMREAAGVGLAAPQVGLSWRLFVANPTGQPVDDQILINPRLTEVDRATDRAEEGCLSIPDVTAVVSRSKRVTIEAMNLDGQLFTMPGDGLMARIWQHELDHLDGVLIVDRMAEIDRMANKHLLSDLESTYARRGSA